MTTSDPIRDRDATRADDVAGAICRRCALCEHTCFEFEWLCMCCRGIERREDLCHRVRIHGPLLPPHVPAHVLESLTTYVLQARR